MKKVIVVLIVLGVGGWLFYNKGILPQISSNVASAASAGDQTDLDLDPIELCDQGQYAKAAEILADRVKHEKGKGTPGDLAVLGKAYRGLSDDVKARETFQKLLKEYPTSPHCGDACLSLSALASEAGEKDEETSYLEKAVESYPSSSGGARAALRLGCIYFDKGLKCKARVAYSMALPAATAEEKKDIKKILARLNKEIIFSEIPNEQAPIYCVKSGDSLGRIAKRFGTTIGMIKSINGMSSSTIFPGDRLKIVKGTVHLEAYKSLFLISLFIEGVWIKDYPIGIGANNKTPEGDFVIETKIVNPPWHYRGKVYPAGDPNNVLGTHWMGFKEKVGLRGFGIHGTVDPSSVPGAVSRGCLRMRNHDVKELFDIVPRNTRIIIRP